MIPKRTPRNKLGHLVGNEQQAAEQYIAERQALLIPARPVPGHLSTPRNSWNLKDKLRVTQVTYVDVKNMPIDVVCDLWGVRFGVEWVNHDDVQKEELLAALAQRLINENLLERQTAANSVRTMYRLGTTGWRE